MNQVGAELFGGGLRLQEPSHWFVPQWQPPWESQVRVGLERGSCRCTRSSSSQSLRTACPREAGGVWTVYEVARLHRTYRKHAPTQFACGISPSQYLASPQTHSQSRAPWHAHNGRSTFLLSQTQRALPTSPFPPPRMVLAF